MTDNEMVDIREAIKKRYEEYRLAKPGKYPPLKFNSYPAPYEHLRSSFREELMSQGQADMQEALAAIPSIKTFAKIFHEGYVLKDEKAITACYLYVREKPKELISPFSATVPLASDARPTSTPTRGAFRSWAVKGKLFSAGWAMVVGLVIYTALHLYQSRFATTPLVITTPATGTTVRRIMIAEGKAPRAAVVWLVIHPLRMPKDHAQSSVPEYYVQDPVKAAEDGTWKGIIYIGSVQKNNRGMAFQIRAFVNPVISLSSTADQFISKWPEAELSSSVVEVVRGAGDN